MELGFFLKKFITFFVEPFGMVLIVFAFGFYFLFNAKYRVAKAFLGFALGLLLLFSYHPFSNFLVKNLENQYSKYEYKENIKYIHVLGSGHNTDESQPLSSQVASKRVLEGVIIHLQTPNSKLIFTGYEGNTNISNAQMNASLAIALGVKAENIIINGEPKDTKEEAIFTQSLIGDEAFVLVTSASHMPRSMKLFQSLSLNPIPAPTDFHKSKVNGYLTAPGIGYMRNSNIAMHEYFGILWSMLKK
ncbi:YdcF family protein [Candidatus Sulfurimonas marisnigri]|uniref:YdcF family protein n=1 Tax=Candidatus Sulfurimonas marisnigri TaxID=2740405 RepID=A0A7S7M372_9BACT|nr:ElyC/SanA/YdcF family protein [Candidatus Sulfurimonas marisnigri]QOY55744.1 YdcF family protein [Candidatus Sulfurimonas marisnigri]